MIHAHDFCPDIKGCDYPFGTDPVAIAAGLRKLARQIESGLLLSQSIIINTSILQGDFTSTRIILNLVEKKVEP